jgi:hypothetical protein
MPRSRRRMKRTCTCCGRPMPGNPGRHPWRRLGGPQWCRTSHRPPAVSSLQQLGLWPWCSRRWLHMRPVNGEDECCGAGSDHLNKLFAAGSLAAVMALTACGGGSGTEPSPSATTPATVKAVMDINQSCNQLLVKDDESELIRAWTFAANVPAAGADKSQRTGSTTAPSNTWPAPRTTS